MWLSFLGILFIIFIVAAIITGIIKLIMTVCLQQQKIEYMQNDITSLFQQVTMLKSKKK